MTPVFSHGRLRLYLLKLLSEGPKHGYELIRLLENRFHGLYAPSAGTIYPRLARMEADGLITHTASGGRKVYDITAAGRDELAHRESELAQLESEIHASVADLTALANEVEQGVRGSLRDLKRELRQATREAQSPRTDEWRHWRDTWLAGGPPRADATRPSGATVPSGAAAATGATAPADATVPGTDERDAREPQGSRDSGVPVADLERKAADLLADVSRLIRLGRATPEDMRVAGTVLDSVREQLRHILRG
jgi:DNA-binding PadR family transcriptional regulator